MLQAIEDLLLGFVFLTYRTLGVICTSFLFAEYNNPSSKNGPIGGAPTTKGLAIKKYSLDTNKISALVFLVPLQYLRNFSNYFDVMVDRVPGLVEKLRRLRLITKTVCLFDMGVEQYKQSSQPFDSKLFCWFSHGPRFSTTLPHSTLFLLCTALWTWSRSHYPKIVLRCVNITIIRDRCVNHVFNFGKCTFLDQPYHSRHRKSSYVRQ